MLSFKDFLLEGIIKVDKKVLSFINSSYYVLLSDMVNFLLDEKSKKIIDNLKREHEGLIEDFIRDNKILKSKTGYRNIPYVGYDVEGIFDFFLEINKESDIGAEYHRKNHHKGTNRKIISYLDSEFFNTFMVWLKNPSKQVLNFLIKEKVDQVEHELGHLVEDFILDKRVKENPNIKINKFKNDYYKDRSAYLTSNIEFEPMIISMVRKFISNIRSVMIKNEHPMSVNEYKQRIDNFLNDDTEDFLFYSKRLTPTKYKTLIKKIYVELIDNIETLQEEGYLEK